MSMTALVTGAGGFIGSHLVEALLRDGHAVRALVRYNGRGEWGHLAPFAANPPKQLDVRLGDVTDPYLVRDLVTGCDLVFHLAVSHWDSVFLPCASLLCGHQCPWHAQHLGSLPPSENAPSHHHFH